MIWGAEFEPYRLKKFVSTENICCAQSLGASAKLGFI